MKNFVQEGTVLSLAAPYDRLSGQGAKIGNTIFGIASVDVLNTVVAGFMVEGVFDIAKTASKTFSAGDKAYWDDTAKSVTSVVSGNMCIGFVTEAALSGDATVRVKIGDLPAPAAADTVLTAAAALDFPSINAVSTADLTITVTGAEVGDAVALGLPAAPAAGLVFFGFVSATDTVKVRAMNITASPVDAASATYRATVFKA